MRYHTQLLTLDLDATGPAGDGARCGWTLLRIGTVEERMEMDREMKSLEERLGEVERWEARVKELDELLKGC